MTTPRDLCSRSWFWNSNRLATSKGPVSLMVHKWRDASVWESIVRRSSMAQDYIAVQRRRLLFLTLVGPDHAVADCDNAVRVLGDVVLVGHHDDGVPLRMQAVH